MIGFISCPSSASALAIGVDAEPLKLLNSPGKQQTFEGLPVGAMIEFTITGVNDAGEGQPSEPVSVVVT